MLSAIIVDDEIHAIKMLQSLMLESEDISIQDTFTNPKEALDYSKENRFDIAFLDIEMPGICGLSLAQRLLDINQDLEIVFVTAYNQYAIEAFEVSAIDYILKPVCRKRLAKTIKRLLKKNKIENTKKINKIRSFGEFNIYKYNEENLKFEEIKFRTSKAKELLAFLYTHHDKNVHRDVIIEKLWEGISEEKVASSLYTATHYLRKELSNNNMGVIIKCNKGFFCLLSDNLDCDLIKFEEIFSINDINKENIKMIEDNICLYSGAYLDSNEYSWAIEYKSSFERIYIKTMLKTIAYYFNTYNYEKCIKNSNKIINVDPFEEKAYEYKIKSYIAMGNRANAIKCFQELKDILEKELKLHPNEEICNLIKYL